MSVAIGAGAITIDGRPVRVLHIGNIANNAYNIAKLQREAGIEADVLCYDYYHIMGCPEWEDSRFEGKITDQFYPKWHTINLNGYTRPDWFIQGDRASCIRYLIANNQGRDWAAAYYRLRMTITQRYPWILLYFLNLQVYIDHWKGKKLNALARSPVTVSQKITNWLAKTTCIPTSFLALIQFAIISCMMLLAAFFLLPAAMFCFPFIIAAIVFIIIGTSIRAFVRLLAMVPDHSRRFAVHGIAWWSRWLQLPSELVTITSARLDRCFNTIWFSRTRGRILLSMALLPWYAIATLMIAVLVQLLLLIGVVLLCVIVAPACGIRRMLPCHANMSDAFHERCQQLISLWSKHFPYRPALTYAELQPYKVHFKLYQQLLSAYDIVQGFATDPIWPLLCDKRPYVAYEHGTLREIPFEDTTTGKLTALAYRLSDHTFITNGDCRECALRLGVINLSPTLHGIDDRKFEANKELRTALLQQYGVNRLYLCSIRHDWAVKGTDQHIRALPELVARTGKDFRLIMIQWGEMVDESKELVRALGVEEQLIWIDPLPKRKLIDWIGAMDCVLDQIMLPHFGATAPEAMGCGIPVISSYNPDSTRWIVAEPAPILAAFNPEQIVTHLVQLTNPKYWSSVAEKSLTWFQHNHSSVRLLKDHLDVYGELFKAYQIPLGRVA